MERGGDCDCCFYLSHGGTDAILDCGLRRWPEVGFGEIAIDVLQARFHVADHPPEAPAHRCDHTIWHAGWSSRAALASRLRVATLSVAHLLDCSEGRL